MTYTIVGKPVGPIGYGLMSLTAKPIPDAQAFSAIRAALDSGCNYLNGGEFYGPPDGNSLALLRRYLETYPEDASRIVVNIKGCLGPAYKPRGDRAGVRESVDACLRTLGPRGTIDQFEPGRKDPNVDYAGETLAAIAEYVNEGKVGGVSCSEVSAATLRDAAAKVRVTSVEVEMSLFYNEPMTNGLLEACAELDIPVLAYSPLGRGLLGGKIKSAADIPQGDMKHHHPRFQGDNLTKNLELVAKVEDIARRKGCTVSQVAINWLLALSRRPGMPNIIPIPGSSNPDRVRENGTIVELTDEDMAEIDAILSSFTAAGTRYPEQHMPFVNA